MSRMTVVLYRPEEVSDLLDLADAPSRVYVATVLAKDVTEAIKIARNEVYQADLVDVCCGLPVDSHSTHRLHGVDHVCWSS